MKGCEEIRELLHGYLDGELLQSDEQRASSHLEDCPACLAELESFRKLKQEVKAMKLQEPTEQEWQRARPTIVVRAARGTGWSLLVAGTVALIGFGAYEFAVDPAVQALEKTAVLAVVLGLAALLASVLQERVQAARTDRYKEVEK